jgi:P27 family predicted phage terminase small subunit
MGKRGPAPTPTNVLRLKGNPSRRPLNDTEPTPPDEISAMPDPPTYLDEYGLEEWNKKCTGLHAMGILSEIDDAILAAYCDSVSVWRRCNEHLKIIALNDPLKALISIAPSGYPIQHVLVGMANVAKRDAIKYAQYLGLSASARRELGVKKQDGKKSKYKGLISSGANKNKG